MDKLTQWIKQHQVTSFFALTYVLSWGLWLPWMLTRIELLELLGFIALFVPALACIVIARVVEPGTAEDSRRARRMAFLAAWVLVTAIFVLNARSSSGIPVPVAVVVFAVVGLIPAFVIASGFSANPGVRARLASLVRPRGHLLWYLLALLLVPALRLLSVPISRLLGWETISAPAPTGGAWALAGSNVAFEFLPVTQVQFVLEAVIAIAVVVGDRMWRKLPAGSRAVYEAAPRAGASDEGGIRHATV
jgi:hypothetical protein